MSNKNYTYLRIIDSLIPLLEIYPEATSLKRKYKQKITYFSIILNCKILVEKLV